MSHKYSTQEIKEEIKALENLLLWIPSVDGHGIETHPAIAAQIEVLKKRMSLAKAKAHFTDYHNDAYRFAFVAAEWLETGKSQFLHSGPMSDEWKQRVNYVSACTKYNHDCQRCPCYPYFCY